MCSQFRTLPEIQAVCCAVLRWVVWAGKHPLPHPKLHKIQWLVNASFSFIWAKGQLQMLLHGHCPSTNQPSIYIHPSLMCPLIDNAGLLFGCSVSIASTLHFGSSPRGGKLNQLATIRVEGHSVASGESQMLGPPTHTLTFVEPKRGWCVLAQSFR